VKRRRVHADWVLQEVTSGAQTQTNFSHCQTRNSINHIFMNNKIVFIIVGVVERAKNGQQPVVVTNSDLSLLTPHGFFIPMVPR
jgi:hypothetical protein